MSLGIFSDQAVGLEVRRDQVVTAWVRRGLRRWVVVETSSVPCGDPEDLPEIIAGITARIPRHIPIIPVAPDLLHEVVDVPPGSVAGPAGSDLLLNQMVPFSPGMLQWGVAGPAPGNDRALWIITSRNESEMILALLNREGLRSPGVMDAGTALTGVFDIFPESPDGHGMLVDVNGANIRMICVYMRRIVFMRSILRSGLDILPDIAVTIKTVQNKYPDWRPAAISLMNHSLCLTGPDDLNRWLPPVVPVIWNPGDEIDILKKEIEHDTLFAIGAAVVYLVHGRKRFLRPWDDTRPVIPMARPRMVISLVLLLVLLLMASWDVWIRTDAIRSRFQSAPAGFQTDFEAVMGLMALSPDEFDPGSSLGGSLIKLAEASDESIAFNDIRGDANQLTLSGRISDLAGVSEFTSKLSAAFPKADISVVSMERSEDESMDVTIQVSGKMTGDVR